MVVYLAVRHLSENRRRTPVRNDLTGVDLTLLQVSLTAVAKVAHGRAGSVGRDDLAELYRRYLWIFLDGIRAARDVATNAADPVTDHPADASHARRGVAGRDRTNGGLTGPG